jgi:hypothetical protein
MRRKLLIKCYIYLMESSVGGPMNTRALVTHILAAKGLDGGDRVLAKSVAGRSFTRCAEKRKQREARLRLVAVSCG